MWTNQNDFPELVLEDALQPDHGDCQQGAYESLKFQANSLTKVIQRFALTSTDILEEIDESATDGKVGLKTNKADVKQTVPGRYEDTSQVEDWQSGR